MTVKPKIIQGGVSFGDDVLANYDEGTWTPSQSSASNLGGSPVYGTGTYTRIGNTVFARIEIITGYTITTAGNYTSIVINTTGLPSVSSAAQLYGSASARVDASPYEVLPAAFFVASGGNAILSIGSTTGLGVANGDAITIRGLHFQYTIA